MARAVILDTGGSISLLDRRQARHSDLFPVKALSRHFRGTMVRLLRRAWQDGQLRRVIRPGEVERLLDRLMDTEWVVYSKHCLQHSAIGLGSKIQSPIDKYAQV